MQVTETALPEVKILEPTYFEDSRGYFCETYSKRALAEYGIHCEFVQDNHSLTLKKGTIRGIHFQKNPHPQSKLVRCIRGRILDVAVDLRRDSPTYKQWVQVELSAKNHKQLWIPAGFGHGLITLEDNCEVQYKVDEFYFPECDRGIAWNDPAIGVAWGTSSPILSEKDANSPPLCKSDVDFTMEVD